VTVDFAALKRDYDALAHEPDEEYLFFY